MAPSVDPTNIWYVNPLPSYPAWGASSQQFEDNAASMGYVATAVGPPKIDAAAMIDMIDQALVDKAAGILTCNIDPATFKSSIEKAQAAGVVMITIGCVDEISDYAIGTDNKAWGETAVDVITEGVGPDAQIGIVSTDQSTPNQVEAVEAFKAKLAAEYPDAKVVAWESGKGDQAIDAQKITAMIAANPGLNAIWCVEGTCPGGAPAGLREAGKQPGDIFVLGIDDVETTLAAIEDGWVSASVNQCWFYATPLAVELMQAKIAGNPSDQRFWPIPTDIVTKDSLPYAGCPDSAIPTLN